MMRPSIFMAVLAAQVVFVSLRAQNTPDGKIELPAYPPAPAAEGTGNTTAFSLAEGWLAENAPECPPALTAEIAAKFVEQLSLRYPGQAERLARADISIRQFESLLWQVTATRLSGPAYEAVRQTFAGRRVRSVLSAQGGEVDARAVEAAVLRLKNDSSAAYRRLAEGRMEDEELLRIPGLTAGRDAPRREAVATAAKPKALTAQEIAGEFSRRNQVGAAAAKLRAYRMNARITNPDGAEQELQLFKLRPGYFRLHVRVAGKDAQVLAYDGVRYWRQAGPRIEQVNPEALGALRYLGEFVDPFFEAEGRQFTRLDDTVVDGRKCYRIRFQRPDGSGYVAVLDQENFHQVARENPDGTSARFSDFRDFAGLTIAYHEELVLANGQTTRLEIRRLVPNPGLIAAFFAAPASGQLDLGPLEQALAKTSTP